jgi:hypothetical protein
MSYRTHRTLKEVGCCSCRRNKLMTMKKFNSLTLEELKKVKCDYCLLHENQLAFEFGAQL